MKRFAEYMAMETEELEKLQRESEEWIPEVVDELLYRAGYEDEMQDEDFDWERELIRAYNVL